MNDTIVHRLSERMRKLSTEQQLQVVEFATSLVEQNSNTRNIPSDEKSQSTNGVHKTLLELGQLSEPSEQLLEAERKRLSAILISMAEAAELAPEMQLPEDWADQHDHYLYGVSKKACDKSS